MEKGNSKVQSKKITAKPNTQDIAENKFIALLSYIFVLCFVPLLLKQESAFAQFHAKQGLALFIVEVIALVFTWTIILAWLGSILFLLCMIASVYGIILVWNGKMEQIPGITWIVQKINI